MSQFKIIWRKFWKLVTTFPMTEELELARFCARREVSLPRQRHYFCHSSSASEKCSCRNVQWWDLFPAGKQPVKSDYGLPHLMFFLIAFSFTSTRKVHSDFVTAPKAAPKYSPIIFSECSVLSYPPQNITFSEEKYRLLMRFLFWRAGELSLIIPLTQLWL